VTKYLQRIGVAKVYGCSLMDARCGLYPQPKMLVVCVSCIWDAVVGHVESAGVQRPDAHTVLTHFESIHL
jgi:hypothetical protein